MSLKEYIINNNKLNYYLVKQYAFIYLNISIK
jgi:hypothetical protein